MRAMRTHGPEQALQMDEIEPPAPGPGQVRLTVRACGVNFADTLMVAGTYQEKPPHPFSPGIEVCGVVEAVGEGVDIAIGTRVAATTGHGGMAEMALAPAAACTPVPEALSDVAAAAIPVAYGTSHVGLDYKAGLRPAERLLVLGAAGGVGLTSVEVGRLMGAEVVACARGTEKLAIAKDKGAHHLIDADDGADVLRDRVKALGGADVVVDPVGGDFWKAALRASNFEARLLPLGFASGDVPQIPANILLVKNLTAIGFYWGAYYKHKPRVLAESFKTLFSWFEEGALTPHVSHELPLAEANAALDLLRTRKATGKVVLTM